MGIGLYIHIPFCDRKCKYCDFYSVIGLTAQKKAYIDRVVEEGRGRLDGARIDTVYVGGGTPTCLEDGELTRLIEGLGIDTGSLDEFTVEGNPNSFGDGKLSEYLRLGVTRVSVGVQSLTDRSLRAIGRLHDAETAVKCLARLVKSGLRVSADYMLGIPFQTGEVVRREVKRLVGLGVEHVSCYGLILEDGTELARAVRAGELEVSDDDAAADLYDIVAEVLRESGLERYETSSFGRPCLHNMGYWTLKEYIGLGAAAHGMVTPERLIAWQKKENNIDFCGLLDDKIKFMRYYNAADIEAYSRVKGGGIEAITAAESADEYVMLGLRLSCGVDMRELAAMYGADRAEALKAKAAVLDKYLNLGKDYISVKDEYVYVANSIIAELI